MARTQLPASQIEDLSIKNADIATDANIAISKIAGLNTALDSKLDLGWTQGPEKEALADNDTFMILDSENYAQLTPVFFSAIRNSIQTGVPLTTYNTYLDLLSVTPSSLIVAHVIANDTYYMGFGGYWYDMGNFPSILPGTPSFDLFNCILWLKSDAGVTKDGNNLVSIWSDQSGKGNHFTQSNSTYQPTLMTGGRYNLPYLLFSTSYMSLPDNNYFDFSVNGTMHSIFVVQFNSSGSQCFFGDRDAALDQVTYEHFNNSGSNWGRVRDAGGTQVTASGGTITTGTYYYIEAIRDATSLKVFLNGTQTAIANNSNGIVAQARDWYIGKRGAQMAYYANMNLYEVLMFNRYDETVRGDALAYISAKYGL